jgi:hypothetical protein
MIFVVSTSSSGVSDEVETDEVSDEGELEIDGVVESMGIGIEENGADEVDGGSSEEPSESSKHIYNKSDPEESVGYVTNNRRYHRH